MNIITQSLWSRVLAISAVGIMMSLGLAANLASAHNDPINCFATGVNLSLAVYRNDGTTPVGGNTVAVGETIKYQATLSHAGVPNCNYEGGDLDIITPDGVNHDVDGGTIPLINGASFTGTVISYVVTSGDIGGDNDLDASAVYSGGTSHLGEGNVSPVGATTPAATVVSGNIIVDKVTDPAGDLTEFDFTTSYGPSFTLADASTATTSGPLVPAATYDVTEAAETGWDNTSINCVSSLGDPADNDGQDLDLDAGETITCTFTNQKDSKIIVDKVTVPEASLTEFDFTTTYGSPFTLTDAATPNDSGDIDPGVYDVTEGAETGWTNTAVSCISSTGDPVDNDGQDLDLDAGETITCTFTNSLNQGKIELLKDFVGTPESVTLEIGTTQGGSETDSQVLGGDGTTGENTVVPGTYYVSETLTTPANYTSVLACFNDVNDDDAVDGGDTAHVVGVNGDVAVGTGDDVLCRFTNTFNPGHIIVDKVTDPANDPTEFDFNPSWSETNFTLTDQGAPVDSGELTPGNYSVAELAETGWDLTSAICDGEGNTPASITLAAGQTVTCVFTNTQQTGNIIVVKQTDPEGDLQTFEFDTNYGSNFNLADNAQNDSGALVAGTYSVAEVNIPANWALTSATCDSTDEADASTPGNINLGPGETITCTFTNTFTPPGGWCSPGYWRQEHHLDSWPEGYDQTTLWSELKDDLEIGSFSFPKAKKNKPAPKENPTIWEILQAPQVYGGEAFNLVGDLLSGAHPDVNFGGGERVEDCPLN